MTTTKAVLGYIENLELPAFGISCRAKVDTGACTSSLHAEKIEIFERDGREWVRFHVHFKKKSAKIDQICEAPVKDTRVITSSNGQRSRRYIIESEFLIRGQCWIAEISLSHRGTMTYPMLIGRKAISGRFLVDVAK